MPQEYPSPLQWYAEQAEALARYSASKNSEAMMAVVAALILDAGRRGGRSSASPKESISARSEVKP